MNKSPHFLQGIKNTERTKCEIWSRVMGYFRPIEYWNAGKQQEWEDRVMYDEPKNLEN